MEIFFHGTSVLFKKFDIAHALEGDGKAKFGFGTFMLQSHTPLPLIMLTTRNAQKTRTIMSIRWRFLT